MSIIQQTIGTKNVLINFEIYIMIIMVDNMVLHPLHRSGRGVDPYQKSIATQGVAHRSGGYMFVPILDVGLYDESGIMATGDFDYYKRFEAPHIYSAYRFETLLFLNSVDLLQ